MDAPRVKYEKIKSEVSKRGENVEIVGSIEDLM